MVLVPSHVHLSISFFYSKYNYKQAKVWLEDHVQEAAATNPPIQPFLCFLPIGGDVYTKTCAGHILKHYCALSVFVESLTQAVPEKDVYN